MRLLDAYQVGAVFGVNEATVRRWVAARLLPFIRTADGYRFREEDVLLLWIAAEELVGDEREGQRVGGDQA